MPVRTRNRHEPMTHDYLREMIVAAHADGTDVVLTVQEAEALMGEFAFEVDRNGCRKSNKEWPNVSV